MREAKCEERRDLKCEATEMCEAGSKTLRDERSKVLTERSKV